MPENPAKEFLESLRDNQAERERLRDAVYSDIVKAGQAAGYKFTVEDLKKTEVLDIRGAPWGGHGGRPPTT